MKSGLQQNNKEKNYSRQKSQQSKQLRFELIFFLFNKVIKQTDWNN